MTSRRRTKIVAIIEVSSHMGLASALAFGRRGLNSEREGELA